MTTVNRVIPTDARGALDDVLRAKFGNRYNGMDAGKFGVIVHIADVTPEDESAAHSIVMSHDTTLRTEEQITRPARQAALEKSRTVAQDIDVQSLTKADRDDLIKLVQWLTLEVRYLKERQGL